MLQPWHLYQAKRILQSGGLIAYPTEAVFGLGCLPFYAQTVLELLYLKNRPSQKGLIIVASSPEQLSDFVDFNAVPDQESVFRSWPGPVTWLIPAKPSVSRLIRGQSDKLAVRVSDHPIVQTLCRQVGPMISTSANRSRQAPAKSELEVRNYFQNRLDYIVPGALGSLESPTEIRDAISGEILRPATS